MASEAKGDRKNILFEVRIGQMTPQEAADWARNNAQPPFERRQEVSSPTLEDP